MAPALDFSSLSSELQQLGILMMTGASQIMQKPIEDLKVNKGRRIKSVVRNMKIRKIWKPMSATLKRPLFGGSTISMKSSERFVTESLSSYLRSESIAPDRKLMNASKMSIRP